MEPSGSGGRSLRSALGGLGGIPTSLRPAFAVRRTGLGSPQASRLWRAHGPVNSGNPLIRCPMPRLRRPRCAGWWPPTRRLITWRWPSAERACSTRSGPMARFGKRITPGSFSLRLSRLPSGVRWTSDLDRVAVAFCGKGLLYEVRSDGTLWKKDHPWLFQPATFSTAKWRQVDKRSDWVSIWGVGGTAFGLTSDGTLWTWGIDPTRPPVMDLSAKLKMVQLRIKGYFTPRPIPTAGPRMPAYQSEPRPLMRLQSAAQPQMNTDGHRLKAL